MTPFEQAMNFTTQAERGFIVDDGGPTQSGVTQNTYDVYRNLVGAPPQDVRKMTPGEYQAIMYQMFWQPGRCEFLPLRLAICQFDTVVNSWTVRATKILQEALGIPVDGDFGPQTQNAAASCNDAVVAEKYLDVRWAFMQSICAGEPPTVRLDGYRNRIKNLRAYLLTLAGPS